jgi:hypothetical protein
MQRFRIVSRFAGLALVAALAACSEDPVNSPPRVDILYPEPGFVYTVSPDSMVASVTDDRGIRQVEFRLDGAVISTRTQSPWTTRLPLGTYADGRLHELTVRATDTDGASTTSSAVTVTFDPSLQTVPQITGLLPDPDGSGQLRLGWLAFPEDVSTFEWQVARDDGFADIAAEGATPDTAVVAAVDTLGLAYARVRAVLPDRTTYWSRSERFNGLQMWRQRYDLDGAQMGVAIQTADDGLRLLSHAVERSRVSSAAVQMLAVDDDGQLLWSRDILDDTHLPTDRAVDDDGVLFLGGATDTGGFVARADDEAALLSLSAVGFMRPTALLVGADGVVRAVGADLREGGAGGVVADIAADGAVTAATTFDLETGRDVLRAWPRPDGGFVLAGTLPEGDDGLPGGVWVRGHDDAGAALWSVRLGTADGYLLRDGHHDGAGNYVLTGQAYRAEYWSRFGFVACVDADGLLRWQVTDRDWHFFAGAALDVDGRWVVAGAQRRSIGDDRYELDLGLIGLSGAGEVRWEIRHASGPDSQGWSLAPHEGGGWWVAGTGTGNGFDVDLLRVDDRGALE